ncbi:tetratricopeptide repeat protein [Lentzea sp. NPDC102401]|uniref:helix-turn-helix domain-containing protein n=1 Tax=Lentzea sp. NPDC102401 TaxID=3364128 RepID=UPI0037FB663B
MESKSEPDPSATDFGPELRRLRLAKGMSLSQLAEKTHYSKSQLSKVENGVVPANESIARACDGVLGTGDRLLRLVARMNSVRRRNRLPGNNFFSGLPRETAHFVGRGTELGDVMRLLTARTGPRSVPRICVMHGMPGVGKTALAVRAARETLGLFPDGCLFIDLHGHTPGMVPVPPADALERCLRRLGVAGEHIPHHVDDRAGMFRDRIGDRRMLLVFDNVAHVEQVEPLMPASSSCGVLITSRNRMASLDDAWQVEVDVLPVVDAVTLFQSINSAGVGEPVVDVIVRQCGLLPLTVRIAAVRLSRRDGAELRRFADRLASGDADRLHELDDGGRTVVEVFESSARMLAPSQRTAFLLLAGHPGADFDPVAAAAIAGVAAPAAEILLERLTDEHLLIRGQDGRFRFHDLVREYALRVADRQDVEHALGRLAGYYATAARAADRRIAPHRYQRPAPEGFSSGLPLVAFATMEEAVLWMDDEFDNLVATCRLAGQLRLDENCWYIAHALQGFAFLTKSWDAWLAAQSIALEATLRLGDREAEGYLLNGLGLAYLERHDRALAKESFEAARDAFRSIDDHRGLANTSGNLAWVHHAAGEHEMALTEHQHALRFHLTAGSSVAVAVTLRGIASAEVGLGRFTEAVEHLEQALRTFDAHELPFDRAMALNCLGLAHLRSGELDAAWTAYEAAVECSRACGSSFELARGLEGMAAATTDRDAMMRLLAESASVYAKLGAAEAVRVSRLLDEVRQQAV